jgi:heat shock protein HspQ
MAGQVINLEHKCESDGAADHTAVADKDKLLERYGLLPEADPEQVEDTEDSNDAPNHNDQELKDAPYYAPVLCDG